MPVLAETEYLFIGGSLTALQEGLRLTKEDKRVLITTKGSCLAPEICDTFFWQTDEKTAEFFPEEIKRGALLQPDEAKKYLENLCEEEKIKLLYGVAFLDCMEQGDGKIARFAAKGGIFYVKCKKIFLDTKVRQDRGWEYRTLMQRGNNEKFELLTVTEPQTEKKEQTAEILSRLQEKAMCAFARQKKEDASLILGRFAPLMQSVGETDTDRKLIEWTQSAADNKSEEMISFRTGNGLKAGSICSIHAKKENCDVLVAGGGTAGALAALHAARGGARTVLIEPQYVLGGTSTVGGVSTYWFGNRFEDVKEIDRETNRYMEELGIPRRQGIWSDTDDFHPGVRAWVLQKLCMEAGVEIYYGQVCFGAVCEEKETGREIVGAVTAGDAGNIVFYGKAFLDATGDGDLAVYAGADSCYGSERDYITYWASLAQYTGIHTYQNNFSTMVVAADPADMTRFIMQARKRGEHTFDHGRYVSMRESRHIRTKRTLNLRDLMSFRTYSDALYTCYSNYDPKGKLDADCIYCGVLPPQVQIQIPLSSLLVCMEDGRQITGLYVLGKAIGATHNVFPSIRMQPDLMHQGAVIGSLVAASLSKGLLPEQFSDAERRSLLKELTDDSLTLPKRRVSVQEAVNHLRADSRTHWVDVPFTYVEQTQADSLIVLLADAKEALACLQERLKKENDDELRQMLIGFCIWHGCYDEIQEYADRIQKQLADSILPKRTASTMCAQLLPDHGVMPETVYQLNLLGLSGREEALPVFEQVLKMLIVQERDYQDIKSGIYHYIEAFAYAAEHSNRKEWIPMLHELLKLPELKQAADMQEQSSLMTERLWILRLILCRSLVRLSDEKGKRELEEMLTCPCMAIRLSAEKALKEFDMGARTEKIW